MARTTFTILAVLVAILGGVYQLHFKSWLKILGLGHVIREVGNKDCSVVPELQACEKIILHQPTGVLYLACATPSSRVSWMPSLFHFDPTSRSTSDYVATYDPLTSTTTKLIIRNGFRLGSEEGGLNVHGMDVVPSSSNPHELFVYLVNHRPFLPIDEVNHKKAGANTTIEIFKTTVGGSEMVHLNTVYDPEVIVTPNDVFGYPDGESFYFTNEASVKTGLGRIIPTLTRSADSSIGYCSTSSSPKCKFASNTKVHDANGITGSRAVGNDTIYVANALSGSVTSFERQSDMSLVLMDVIQTEYVLDNLALDQNGALWAGALPNALHATLNHFRDPGLKGASAAFRIGVNTGQDVFYGKKFRVDRVFEDDGKIASVITSAVYDAQRGRLFLHGIMSPQLAICKI